MLLLFIVKESFLSRLVSFFTESKLPFLTLLGGKGTKLTQRLFSLYGKTIVSNINSAYVSSVSSSLLYLPYF